MVPSMVPYYYMQMQQRIKHENEFDWHMKVRERQGVGEKLTDRENEIDTQLVSSHRKSICKYDSYNHASPECQFIHTIVNIDDITLLHAD